VERVDLSIVGMCVVDAYLVFTSAACNENIAQRDFYFELAFQLIDKSSTLWVVVAGR
jgi:hypothetical protein